MRLPHRPSHGVIAGYTGLLLGTIAVAGGPAFAAGLINGHKLKPGTVTSAKLAKNAVTATKIRPGAVKESALAASAITGAKVKDRSLGLVDLSAAARAALEGGPVALASVTSATIVSGAVTTEKLAAGAVNSAAVADGAITTAKIADGSIAASKLAVGAVTGSAILATVVPATGHADPLTISGLVVATCLVGQQALGGGVAVADGTFPTGAGSIGPVVTINAPTIGVGNIPTGWQGKVRDSNVSIAANFTVYAICA